MKNKFISVMIKLVVVLVIILAIIFAVFIVSNAKEDNKQADKIEKEITYLDTKIINLINNLNNIKLENYKITITKVKQEDSGNSGESKEKSGTEEESKETETSKEEQEITKVEQEIVTTGNTEEVNWEWLKGETQILYSSWGTIVLDFYDIRVSSDKIVEFSNGIDKILLALKQEDKKVAAAGYAKLYSILPDFVKNTQMEELKKKTIETKSHILNAYAYVETEDWDRIQTEIINAEKKFTEVVNDISNQDDQRKYNINKSYILLQELKNSLTLKDKGIFHMKYKILLEELNTLL